MLTNTAVSPSLHFSHKWVLYGVTTPDKITIYANKSIKDSQFLIGLGLSQPIRLLFSVVKHLIIYITKYVFIVK